MRRIYPNPFANTPRYAAAEDEVPSANASGDYIPAAAGAGITDGSSVGDQAEWDGDSWEPIRRQHPEAYHQIISSTIEEWGGYSRFGSFISTADSPTGFQGSAANGGSVGRISSANLVALGNDFAFNGMSLFTGTTNNATGYAGFGSNPDGILGLETPSATGDCLRYFECFFRTATTIFTSSNNGYIAVGFRGSHSAVPSNGMWLEFRYDGTTNDTTWHWVNRKDGTQARTACTSTSLATNTLYRVRLLVSRASNGDVTQTWDINGTTGTISTANANVGTAYIPTDTSTSTGDAYGFGAIVSKAGSAHATTQACHLAWMAWRVRRTFAPDYVPTLWS